MGLICIQFYMQLNLKRQFYLPIAMEIKGYIGKSIKILDVAGFLHNLSTFHDLK